MRGERDEKEKRSFDPKLQGMGVVSLVGMGIRKMRGIMDFVFDSGLGANKELNIGSVTQERGHL